MNSSSKASKLASKCRLAEQTERFDDMLVCVKEMVAEEYPVDEEFRNFLSIGYKNVMGANRSAWRAVCNLEQKEMDKVGPFEPEIAPAAGDKVV